MIDASGRDRSFPLLVEDLNTGGVRLGEGIVSELI